MNLKEISFKAMIPGPQLYDQQTGDVTGELSPKCVPLTFKLGLGPCGRFVESLESAIDYHGVTITQVSYPEDYGHVRESWERLNELNVTNMHLIAGTFHYSGTPKTRAFGYGSLEHMAPTKEQHEANIKLASEFHKKYMVLHEQRETKVFFYKLEDVRGRIMAIR